MKDERSIFTQVIGLVCLFIGLFLGIPLVTGGLVFIILTIAMVVLGTANDYTGLGIVIGLPMAVLGIGLSWTLIIAVRLLNLTRKHVVVAASTVGLFVISFFIYQGIVSKM